MVRLLCLGTAGCPGVLPGRGAALKAGLQGSGSAPVCVGGGSPPSCKLRGGTGWARAGHGGELRWAVGAPQSRCRSPPWLGRGEEMQREARGAREGQGEIARQVTGKPESAWGK